MSKLDKIRWAASIQQEYTAPRGGRTSTCQPNGLSGTQSTQVALLHFRASSAQEAMDIAEKWLEESGILNAYVDSVYLDGMYDVDVTPKDSHQ